MTTYGRKVNVEHAEIVAGMLQSALLEGEDVEYMTRITKVQGMLAWFVVTNQRVLGVRVNPEVRVEIDLDLDDVTAVTVRGLLPSLHVATSDSRYDFGTLSHGKDVKDIHAVISDLANAHAPDHADGTAPTGSTESAKAASLVDNLQALAKLHASGALTDAEFATAKAAALAETAGA